MKNILLYYNFSYPLGGGDYLPLTFAAELQKNCKVTLAVDSIVGFERAVRFFNLPLDTTKLKVVQLMPKNYDVHRHNTFFSYIRNVRLKKLAKHADICISTVNIIDFGCPAHHFINFLAGVDKSISDVSCNALDNRHFKQPLLKRIRTFFCESLMRSILGMRSKRTIICDPKEHIYPNSQYVNDLMEKFYGSFNGMIFYPPTTFEAKEVDIERNSLRVTYIGRIHPDKRISEIISIVERARSLSGKDLQLVIAGPLSDTSNYCTQIRQKAEKNNWIMLMDGIWGKDKVKMLCSSSYAVHARRNEEFGISVTEYLKAGLIPIVPNEGGSMEVVDNPALTYHDNEEAAQILAHLLLDDEFRKKQLQHCFERAKIFSLQAYMERQKKVLDKIVNGEL